MSDDHGWPDGARPGVPLNPERDGWHWLQHKADTFCAFWVADDELSAWTTPIGDDALSPHQITDWRYLAPCHTPAEVAAMLAEAKREGMKEAAGIAGKKGSTDGWDRWDRGYAAGRRDAAAAILAAAQEPKP